MKWVRLRNKGSFDFVKSMSMLGASVKLSPNSIGLYGTGLKAAMAQAARMNITIKIASDGKIWTSTIIQDEFRNKEFDIVGFRSNTGKVVRTPITTNFGREDWNQKWFILREFYSNLLDEGGEVHIIDGCEAEDGFVDVYLPYNEFKEYIDELDSWFNQQQEGLKPGSGRVYKKGVYVGKIEGIDLDMWSNDIQITESRTMLQNSAESKLGDLISVSKDVEVWSSFFKSERKDEIYIYVGEYNNNGEVLDASLKKVYGENYAICPQMDSLVKDCFAEGFHPVVLSTLWTIKPKLNSYLDKIKDIGTRELTLIESELVNKAKRAISFITGGLDFTVKVISDTNLARLGDANRKTGLIRLNESVFTDYKKLVSTLIHEVGHLPSPIGSGAGDYERSFVDFFVNKLTDVCL